MGHKLKQEERRKFPRIESRIKVRYKEFHSPLKVFRNASCINIGVGGCRIETFEKLSDDLILTLLINIPVPYSYQIVTAKIFAKVVQTKSVNSKNHENSLYFIAVDRKGSLALRQWIERELRAVQKRNRHRRRKRTGKTIAAA